MIAWLPSKSILLISQAHTEFEENTMPEVVKVLCLNQALLMVFVEVSNQNVFFSG